MLNRIKRISRIALGISAIFVAGYGLSKVCNYITKERPLPNPTEIDFTQTSVEVDDAGAVGTVFIWDYQKVLEFTPH